MPALSKKLHSRPPYERMMYIHDQVKGGKHPNCTELSRHLEVNRRTILRDIEFMKDRFQLPIEYDPQSLGFCYTSPVAQFPGVAVSEAELFAILVAQKAISNYEGTPFYQPLVTAFKKLSEHLGENGALHLADLGEAMDIRLAGPEVLDEENFRIVLKAVQDHRPLEFKYRKQAARSFDLRKIHPYQLVCVNSRWYVIGHDLGRRAIRSFVLGRMRDSKILSGEFTRPSEFNIKDHLKGSFGIFKGQGDYEVVILLDNWAADVFRNRRWHGSQKVTELPGGEMQVSFHLDNLEEVEQWVLSWGRHATVVKPKLLADRVLGSAQELVRRYSDPAISKSPEGQTELKLAPKGA
ncbi:MAG: WYL domain-containing protein [Verrucomicrobia bacterium]|nr:WYL domain-containing protein [Verrucomicrobiota bacterium]